MNKKIKENIVLGLKHPIIYTALVAAVCRIAESQFYKRVLHTEMDGLVANLPWIIFGMYATTSLLGDLPEARKKADPRILKFLNPIAWNLVIVITTALSIAIPYFRQ
jgi:hypothetical protein